MKLLFVHGTKIKEDNNGQYYTGGSYDKDVWNRYLSISDELTVIARKESKIYSVEYAKNKFNYFNSDKIRFVQVPDRTKNFKVFFSKSSLNNIKKIIKEEVLNCNYLIARLPSAYGAVAIKCAKKYSKPYLIELVGCPWDSMWHHSIKGKILAPFSYYKTKKLVRGAPYVVYVTKEFLQNRYPTDGKSTNCSDVLLENFNKEILENRITKINDYTKNKKLIIGTVGAVNIKYKGQEYVIKALADLKEKGINNFEYKLVGGGDNSYLKNIAKNYNMDDQIGFLGRMPHEDVFKWLEKIDLYIQPSKTEGLPRALIEAMSKALPSLGSNAGGIPELLEDKYIFQKGKKGVKQISNILSTMNKNDMKQQAKRNYNESKKYKRDVIENRRQEFFEMFVNDIKNNNI